MENLAGVVGTLGNEPFETLRYSGNGLILGNDGRPVPVIHQYERQKFEGVLQAVGIL